MTIPTSALLPALLTLLAPLSGAAPDPKVVDFASLSDFDYVEGMELPGHVTRLHQERVEISGFMRREVSGTGPVEYFMLINDACGCNGMPYLNEVVFCAMPPGETTEIEPGTVSVSGTLYVGETHQHGVVISLYTMDVEKIGD